MPNIRDIKRRIRAVTNTQQITRAMKMVAASKMRRVQDQLWAARPYAQKLTEVAGRLALAPEARDLPLVAAREVKTVGYVLITGDRGLAGAYNSNLIHLAEKSLGQEEKRVNLVAIGRKGLHYFRQRGVEILQHSVEIEDDPHITQARELARELMSFFLQGQLDEVNLVYACFHSALDHVAQVERLLPIVTPTLEEAEEIGYIYEPEPMGILTALLPRYCETKVYQALLEAKASEHSARMIAMDGATSNADEMIEGLNLSYNKARQSAITTEILEVATGAEALKDR
ncbi:MAG: ATP synthase F1 subunit gamma [Firmicutes bacterium]|nr:ATP synthase F1 subunit gamma [Bacillota bacterium]